MRSGARLAWLIGAGLIAAGTATWAEQRADQHKLDQRAEALTGGDVARGRSSFQSYGCGGCHYFPGVPQAQGKVGPPLKGIAGRAYIAGKLGNSPASLIRWITHPQAITPGTAMPELGVTARDARDIAALLYARS